MILYTLKHWNSLKDNEIDVMVVTYQNYKKKQLYIKIFLGIILVLIIIILSIVVIKKGKHKHKKYKSIMI